MANLSENMYDVYDDRLMHRFCQINEKKITRLHYTIHNCIKCALDISRHISKHMF